MNKIRAGQINVGITQRESEDLMCLAPNLRVEFKRFQRALE